MAVDQGKRDGLVKVSWRDVREHVNKVEPGFSKIVDAINPDDSFPLYLAYYPYGDMDADTQSTLFPNDKGGYYRITDNSAPKDIKKDLGYSANNTPFGMVLDKQIESFVDLERQNISIPWVIYTPGKFFPFTRVLHTKNKRVYSPNGLLSSVAGSRSVFMLPNIGCATNHSNLQREFNVRRQPPKSLYEHWGIFKEIVKADEDASAWRCCVMYFSEKWINNILNDKSWSHLKKYLHEVAWHQFEYEINRVNYDVIFSIIQQNRNLKPNPYLTDTAKHLFSTAIGSVPGYSPVVNESSLPLEALQRAFVDVYGLKKYVPTIMHPSYFDSEKSQYPIYYSLHNPSTHVFSPKSREASSTLFEMRELEYVMQIFSEELSRDGSMCSGTVMDVTAKEVEFNYYHNKVDRHGIISLSSEIESADDRFVSHEGMIKHPKAVFASDSPFLRGCISIRPKA